MYAFDDAEEHDKSARTSNAGIRDAPNRRAKSKQHTRPPIKLPLGVHSIYIIIQIIFELLDPGQ